VGKPNHLPKGLPSHSDIDLWWRVKHIEGIEGGWRAGGF